MTLDGTVEPRVIYTNPRARFARVKRAMTVRTWCTVADTSTTAKAILQKPPKLPATHDGVMLISIAHNNFACCAKKAFFALKLFRHRIHRHTKLLSCSSCYAAQLHIKSDAWETRGITGLQIKFKSWAPDNGNRSGTRKLLEDFGGFMQKTPFSYLCIIQGRPEDKCLYS